GATKVAIIQHFGLPKGRYETKKRDDLIKRLFQDKALKESGDRDQQVRDLLDLLGEFYDLWRHTFQVSTQDDTKEILDGNEDYPDLLWTTYEEILGFLDHAEFQKAV
ncbi:MAG: hypothetical protein PVJ86_03345, partial [Phycisphaerales bacterium]